MTRRQLILIIRQQITDALARQNTAEVMRGVLETMINGLPNEDDPAFDGELPPLQENQYGTHPELLTGAEQIAYIMLRINNLAPVIMPAAPTNGAVDDIGNTFSFDISAGYTSASEYEYTEPNALSSVVKLTAANSYINGTRVTITGLTGPIPTGQLKVRVSGGGAVSPGRWLASLSPFTGTVAPPEPTVYNGSYTTTAQDYTTKCGAGTSGASVTRTATSTANQADADTKARQAAIDAITCPVPLPVYNTEVNAAEPEKAGVAFAPGAGNERMQFNRIDGANAAPISMTITLGGSTSYSDMPGEYAGQGFSFFGANGQRYESTFINGTR